jgi:PAS domain S-box-containing protein
LKLLQSSANARSTRSLPEALGANLVAATGRSPLISALLTLLMSLLLSAVGVAWLHRSVVEAARVEFQHHAQRVQTAVEERFELPTYGLRGLHSLYSMRGQVARDEFRRFVVSRDMGAEFPGVRGFGFIESIKREDLASFEARERLDSAPEFAVRTRGDLPDLHVIKFIEPLSENRRAWGLDIGAEAVRRQGLEDAAARGEIALTGCVTLLQDRTQGPGFLMLMPVYRSPLMADTPAQRRLDLQGFVYAPLAVQELLHDVDLAGDGRVELTLSEGESVLLGGEHPGCAGSTGVTAGPGKPALAEATGVGVMTARHAPRFEASLPLVIGGRPLNLKLSSSDLLDASIEFGPVWWTGTAAGLSSLLLTAMVWLMGAGRRRSVQIAGRMTEDLRQAKQRAEVALRDVQAVLSLLDTHALVSVTNLSGVIIEVNDAFCGLSGYSREELIGQTHRIVNSGQQDAGFWRDLWEQISSGQTWKGEICNRAKDGSLYWVDSVVAPVFDEQGMIEKYMSIRHNITGIKQAKLDLAAQDERLQLALEGGNDGLWEWSVGREQTSWWSPKMYSLLGYSPEEIEANQTNFNALLHHEDRGLVYSLMAQALSHPGQRGDSGSEAGGLDIEARMRCKSGEYRWFRTRAKVFVDPEGQATRMAGSLQDVHERWTAQRQTQIHSEQLDAIFSLSPDGFVSLDNDFRVLYISPATERLTGLSDQQCRGITELALLAQLQACAVPDASAVNVPALAASLARGESLQFELRPPQARVLALRRHQGDSSSIAGVIQIRDVTRETEIDRLKSEFLSTAAHELRTPMASIYGFTELLLTRELSEDKRRTLLQRVYRQSEALIAIVNELLDLARIEAKRGMDFNFERIELDELLMQTVQDFKPPDEREPPMLLLTASTITVRADRVKLAQALRNLLSNAYKYSPGGGAVELRLLSRTDEHGVTQVLVEIEDQGLGMTPEQLARVCERFFRADLSGAIPGTGLGMSIVKEIIELHGGQMLLRSELGQGSVIGFALPGVTP